ncbi:MAG: ester cyclase [Miltoncostaeaceae bacterium]
MTHDEHHRAVIDAFNAADWERYRELVGDAIYVEPASGREVSGDELMQLAQGWRQAFPDLTGTITSATENGDTLAHEITWVGTHAGPMVTPDGELPPTGNPLTVSAALVATFEGERMVSFRHYFDMLGILQATGAIPQS